MIIDWINRTNSENIKLKFVCFCQKFPFKINRRRMIRFYTFVHIYKGVKEVWFFADWFDRGLFKGLFRVGYRNSLRPLSAGHHFQMPADNRMRCWCSHLHASSWIQWICECYRDYNPMLQFFVMIYPLLAWDWRATKQTQAFYADVC